MSVIIRNNIKYGGKSRAGEIIELTQADYDLLPDDKYSDGILYAITDSEDLTANNISYDGSITGLGNTIQNAIDVQYRKINECFQSVSDGKALVASAITDMGVETTQDATFAIMAENILAIKSGGGLPSVITAGDTPILSSSTLAYTCTSTSARATGISITIPKDGTYRFKFSAGRTSTTGTWTTQLYKNGSAISGATATWSSYQATYTGDIACNAGDVIEIYAQSRGSTYRSIISQLVACIDLDII